MRLLFSLLCYAIISSAAAQDQFAGLNTSNRVGILTAAINPAELVNMSNKFEISWYGIGVNVANNQIGFSDLTSGADLESLLFQGNQPVNFRMDSEVSFGGFAFKFKKIAFAIQPKINAKFDVVDVDPNLGDGLLNSGLNSIVPVTSIVNNYNQRISGIVWGDIGITAAVNLINSSKHKVNVGATFRLLFPGSYANLGLDKFEGTITNIGNQAYLNNTTAQMNVAYSGTLGRSFTEFDDYRSAVFGKFQSFAGDLGFNYQWKDQPEENPKKNKNKYKLNIGVSVRNIGAMTFKNESNFSTNYTLNIQPTFEQPLGLNLNQFENIDRLRDIEDILIDQGYLDRNEPEKREFKVFLPTSLSLYADLKLIPSLYVSAFWQQNLTDSNKNDQIAAVNTFTVTPRFNVGFFELFAPFINNEVAGFTSGLGFRLGGFYIGSGSIVTALVNDSKQVDFYTGFRWAFL